MPKNNDSFKRELVDLLKSNDNFKEITLIGNNGKDVSVPEEAEAIQFHYHDKGNDYGSATFTVSKPREVTLYYNQKIMDEKDLDYGNHWVKLIQYFKNFSLRNAQMAFKTANLDKLGDDMKKRTYDQKQASLAEGYYGTRQTSYSDNSPGTIKLIIKHSRPLGENDQRFRNIEKIFLENELGERILVPSKKPSIGRAFARHLAEGGQYNDERWNHINEISQSISKLSGFVRATKNKQFNESVNQIVSEAENHYKNLKSSIKAIQTSRGYNSYFESWTPTLMENDQENDYSSIFTTSRLDPRIEQALPILNRLNIKVNEIAEGNEFESWASNIISEKLTPSTDAKVELIVDLIGPDSEKLALGPDAVNALAELEDLIDDEELSNRLTKASVNPDNDARPIIISWMEEHSDKKLYKDILSQMDSDPKEPKEPKEPSVKNKPETPPKPSTPAAPPPARGIEIPPNAPPPAAPTTPGIAEAAKPQDKVTVVPPKPRNFVAKNQPKTGSGRHDRQGEYRRKEKHPDKSYDGQLEETFLARIKKLSGLS